MQTIMFNSEKGGTGKTTLSCLTASMLAVRGYRVLLIDFDPQGHATLSFGLPKAPALYDLLVRERPIADLVVQPAHESYVLEGTEVKGSLLLLPGNAETHGIPIHIRDFRILSEILDDNADALDFVIIDTAPSAGGLLTLAWNAAQHVVIPSKMEYLDLDGVRGTIEAAKSWNVHLAGIVPNLFRDSTELHSDYLRTLRKAAEQNGWHVFQPIHQRIVWAQASAIQTMVSGLNTTTGRARHEAIRFINDLEGRIQWQET